MSKTESAAALGASPAGVPTGRIVTELRCGVCGNAIGQLRMPPLPPFSSLDFNARTILKPVLALAARKAPMIAPLVECWLNGHDAAPVNLARATAEALALGVVCNACVGSVAPAIPLPAEPRLFA